MGGYERENDEGKADAGQCDDCEDDGDEAAKGRVDEGKVDEEKADLNGPFRAMFNEGATVAEPLRTTWPRRC